MYQSSDGPAIASSAGMVAHKGQLVSHGVGWLVKNPKNVVRYYVCEVKTHFVAHEEQ